MILFLLACSNEVVSPPVPVRVVCTIDAAVVFDAECTSWTYLRDKDNWGCLSCFHPGSSLDYRDVVNRSGLQCQAAQQGPQ
jgi:hypothetical protein